MIKFKNNILGNVMINIYINFKNMFTSFSGFWSLVGFFIFLIIGNQIISGIMLSFSLLPESMIVPLVREEENIENLFIDDFFFLHERGVDILMVIVYFHLLRKIYLNVNDLEQDYAWKNGIFAFFCLQIIVFAGLVLCCTHLSEITLIIAANALHTFFLFIGKAFWWLFTDKLLNSDTMLRMAYLHYIIPFFVLVLGLNHGVDMHYDWKHQDNAAHLIQEYCWWDETLSQELSTTIDIITYFGIMFFFIYVDPESLNYELFMWGDIGMIVDVRFYGVAPHWYFRPFMAWLIVCPFHYIGIFGLVFFFFIFYFQISINSPDQIHYYKVLNCIIFDFFFEKKSFTKLNNVQSSLSLQWQLSFALLCICIWYTFSFLPYGRFYGRVGGNMVLLFSYFYIFIYLGLPFFRYSWSISSSKMNII